MASSSKSNNKEEEEEKKKKKKNKNKIKAATPTKTTPQKSPINKTPKIPENQEKHKIKKKKKEKTTENGSVTDVIEIPSSSCDSQDIEEDEPKKNHTTKSPKTNKRNQKARDDYEDEGDGTMCKFPTARIKRIMKSEDPTLQLPQDVVFLVNKATEKFIEQFCEEAYDCSVQDRKKSLAYKHLSSVVSKNKRFDFLSDYVPVKLKAEAALEQRKLVEDGQI